MSLLSLILVFPARPLVSTSFADVDDSRDHVPTLGDEIGGLFEHLYDASKQSSSRAFMMKFNISSATESS